uniref:Uncharacterized protein n=1 Tax=uncultured delta proteobacterium HF0200_19J16 TaxID=710831 RepID=E0XUC3_9DELT|nr:hypothetical protein [uncultured delta proteobacterium HF0200_19J16]
MSTGTQVWACIKWRFWRPMSTCRSHLVMILKIRSPGQLVPVSFTCCHASTSGLSNR